MKKLFTLCFLIVGLSAAAQKPFKAADTTAKKADTTQAQKPAAIQAFTITLTPQQVQTLYYALDRSNAEHDAIVRPLLEIINQQITAETKQQKKP